MAWNSRSLLTLCSALSLAGCGDDGRTDASATAATSLTSTSPGTITTSSTTDPTSGGPGTTAATTDGSASDSLGTTTDTTTTATTTGTTAPLTSTDGTTAVTTDTTTDTTGTTTDTGSSTGPMPCPEDQLICDGNVAQVCDGMGGFKSETPCPIVCAEPLGCVACLPGDAQCNGQVAQVCKQDGSGFEDWQDCDPLQGLSCDPNAGQCTGACANLGLSYIGCEYYPNVTQQYEGYWNQGNPYAVAVANTTANAAMITVTRGANNVLMDTVAANSVKVLNLPWVAELAQNAGPTVHVVDGSYRLRSTQPVTVYQFNPLNASVTNDASLLLPVNTWTGNYVVVSWPFWNDFGGHPGFYTVTARADNTSVTLLAAKGGTATQPGGGVNNQGHGMVVLNEGDVLQVTTALGGDLTGTKVTADKPVQVIGGHECTQVPFGVSACDHLEESIFPFETLAKEYIVVPPSQATEGLEKAVVVRVVAAEANTTLTFTPDQPVAKVLANIGDFVEIPTTVAKFVVSADKKILVAEYMVGQDAGYGASDPAMILAVPTQQFRQSYLFYAQPNWTANYVDILAPAGASVQVDGAPVANFAAIGNTGFSLAHVKLVNGNGGHSVTSDQKVGITAYGVLNYGSYWYPGGLDLNVIPQ